MARYDFGGSVPDFIFSTATVGGVTNVMKLPAGASLTFYSAKTGGTQYTDLRLASAPSTPVSTVAVGSDGQLPDFQGPDGVTTMWATGGLGRVRLVSWSAASGAAGTPGAPGADGADGSIIHWVTTEPGTSLGVVGDWAFRSNGALYEKTGASTWTLRLNIGSSTGGTGGGLDTEALTDYLATKFKSGIGTAITFDDATDEFTFNSTGGGTGGGGNWYVDPSNPNLIIFPDGEPAPTPEPGDPVAPGEPTNVTATSVPGTAVVNMAWGAPASDGGSPITGYHVYRNLPDWSTTNPVSPTDRTFTLTNFTFGTAYQVGVRAINAIGPGPWKYVTVTPLSTAVGGGPVPEEPAPDPQVPATSAAMALPKHPIAEYHMMYTKSYPSIATMHANINCIILAFAIGDPPNLVGYAGEGSYANLKSALNACRARGVRVGLSLGGAHNTVTLSNRQGVINSFMSLNNTVGPLDFIDFDNEGGNSPIDGRGGDGKYHAVYITEQLRAQRGANFKATMAPNGSNIGSYLPVAKALQNAGVLGWMGQQFYDAPVSDSAMHGRLSEAINTHGILPQNYVMGHMQPSTGYAPDSSYWTVDECIARMNSAWARYPTLAGAYHWERSRVGSADWANRVGNLIKARP